MGKSFRLRAADVEPVYRLVDECRELWADADAWQRHLVRGACRLTGTAVGQYNEQCITPDLQSTQILDETFEGEWRDETARACMIRMYRNHANRATFFPRCMRLAGRAIGGLEATALRRDLRPDDEWYRSFVFNEYRLPGHFDDAIISFGYNRPRGVVVMLATNHDVSDPAPTPRGAAVLALLMRQIAPLVGTSLATRAQHGAHSLSPRLRQTLDRLLAGDSEKQAAQKLNLHPTTVHDYVGELFRRFGVDSRGELMAYFISRRPRAMRDGQPTTAPQSRRARRLPAPRPGA